MPDPITAPDPGTAGQAGAAPAAAGATATAPAQPGGQGTAQGTTPTGQAPAAPAASTTQEPTFFDPKDLDPALLPAFKQMQGTFTKRMQELGQYREKVSAYDAFMTDPVTNLQNLATQYGFALTRREAAAALNQAGQQTAGWDPRSGEAPPDWETLVSFAKKSAKEELLKELGPVVQNVQRLQAQSVEQQLDAIDGDLKGQGILTANWRQHEPAMRQLLQENPTLSANVKRLYNLAMLESGDYDAVALRKAQAQLNASASAARVGSKSTTTSQPAPKKVTSFNDAVEEAKRELASGAKR